MGAGSSVGDTVDGGDEVYDGDEDEPPPKRRAREDGGHRGPRKRSRAGSKREGAARHANDRRGGGVA